MDSKLDFEFLPLRQKVNYYIVEPCLEIINIK